MAPKLVLSARRRPHHIELSIGLLEASYDMAAGCPQRKESKKEQGSHYNVFYDLALEVTHFFYASFLQYSTGQTGQSYVIWDGTTEGHFDTQVKLGLLGDILEADYHTFFMLGFNSKVCPDPFVMSASIGTWKCFHAVMHAWGYVTLEFLDLIPKTFRDLFD